VKLQIARLTPSGVRPARQKMEQRLAALSPIKRMIETGSAALALLRIELSSSLVGDICCGTESKLEG
jgi:hypothetical protein